MITGKIGKGSGLSEKRPAGSAAQVYVDDPNDSTTMKFLGSLKNALIIIAQIVVMTVIFACLFKHGKIKVFQSL